MAVINTNAFGDLDLQSYAYRWHLDNGAATYAFTFSTDKGNYTFLPDDFIAKGVVGGTKQFYANSLLNKNTLSTFYTKYQPMEFGDFQGFDGADIFYQRLKENGFGTSGVLMPEADFQKSVTGFKNYTVGRSVGSVQTGAIQGIGEKDGKLVYIPASSGASQATAWIQDDGNTYAQWQPKLNVFQRLGKEIAKIPLFPEIAAVVVTAAGGASYAPYVYAALKGAALGASGVDPLKAGLMVGINIAAQNLASNTPFSKSIGAGLGIENEVMQAATGKAIIGATVNGARAAIAGGDITKAMLEGAVTAGASSMVPELTKTILGPNSSNFIKTIASNTNLTTSQIQTIIASSFVSGITSQIQGGDFVKAFTNSLVGAGVSQSVANEVGKQVGDTVSPEMREAIVTGTSAVAKTATTAALNNRDIAKEIEANLPATIVATMSTYQERKKNEETAIKEGWANYDQKVAAIAKWGAGTTPIDAKSKDQFVKDVEEFTFRGEGYDTREKAAEAASKEGYNTFKWQDGKIYTIGGQSLTAMDTFVQAMNPQFDPVAYKKVNNLGPEINAAEHYLDVGQYKSLPVSYEQYVDKTLTALPEYDKDFYKEERTAALNAAKAGEFGRVDEIAKFIDKTFTTADEARTYLKEAYRFAGDDREPTEQELKMVWGQNEANAYTIAQAVSAMGVTTFDGSKFATPKLAEDAAKKAGYNTFTANDGNTYRVTSTIDEANIRANVEDQKTFRDAFAMARTQLGDGKTFTWNGKQYTTNVLPADTFDASRTGSIESAATLAFSNGKTKFIASDGKIYNIPPEARSIIENSVNQSPAETARLLRQAVKPEQNEYMAETQRLMESGTRSTMDNISAMTSQLLGTTQRGMANFLTSAGKTYASVTGDMSFDNALTRLGKDLENYAKQSDVYGIDVQKNRIDQAIGLANTKNADGSEKSFWEKAKIIGESIRKNPIGFFDIAGSEVIEELPETAIQIGIALGTGGAGLGGIAAVSAGGTFLETFGNSAEQAYNAAKARGDSDEVAANKAYLNATVGTMLAIGPEIIADKALVAPFMKSIGNSLVGATGQFVGSVATGAASEFVSGLSQSYAEQLIVDPAKANFSKAVTDGIFDMYIGGTAQGALSLPGYALQTGTIVGRDYNGNNVSISDILNGTKVLDSSTVDPGVVIGKTNNNNDITLGGAMQMMPSYDINKSVLTTYAPVVFNNPDLVVGRDILGNKVTYGDVANRITEDKPYDKVFDQITNPTPEAKFEAQKTFLTDTFKQIGYTPTPDQINNMIVANPKGNESLVNTAKTFTFKEVAGQENYGLTDKEIERLLKPDSKITTAEQFKAYIDPLAVTSEEARKFLEEQGYTKPTQEELDQLMGRVEAEAREKSITLADPYFIDSGEIRAAAAAEGFDITAEEAAALAREANEAEGIAAYRAQIDPQAVIDSEAREFFETYGYIPEPDELTQFIASRPEAEIRESISKYVDPRQMTREEAEKYFGEFSYKFTPEEVSPFVKFGKDVSQAQLEKDIAAYVDPRTVSVQEVMDTYKALGIDTPAPEDVTKYVGQFNEAQTVEDITKNIDKARYNALQHQRSQEGLQAQQKNLAQMAMQLTTPEAPVAPAPEAKFLGPFITSTIKQQEFESPLKPFLKEVAETDYTSGQPFEPQMQPGPEVAENTQQGEPLMPSYFTYGGQSDIDRLFSPFQSAGTTFFGQDQMFAAAGGLAAPLMASGGTTRYGQYSGGGLPVVPHSGKARLDFRSGAAVTGPGDGQSDDIPAMLADGEFVIPADVVAALGNGSTKAGSDKLYDMMHSIRAYHRSARPKDLPPPAKKNPLDYLKKSKKK